MRSPDLLRASRLVNAGRVRSVLSLSSVETRTHPRCPTAYGIDPENRTSGGNFFRYDVLFESNQTFKKYQDITWLCLMKSFYTLLKKIYFFFCRIIITSMHNLLLFYKTEIRAVICAKGAFIKIKKTEKGNIEIKSKNFVDSHILSSNSFYKLYSLLISLLTYTLSFIYIYIYSSFWMRLYATFTSLS